VVDGVLATTMRSGADRSSEELMQDLHLPLQSDYQTPEDEVAGSCGIIALELATKLYEEDGPDVSPYIVRFEPEADNSSLTPRHLDEINWRAHIVCCYEGQAYDPLVSPEPIPVEDYKERAFEESDVAMFIENPKSEIRSLLKQPSYDLVKF